MADKTEIIYDLIFNTQAASKDIASLNVQLKTVQDNFTKATGAGTKATAAFAQTGRAFGAAGQGIQNASFQVADFATQVQSGTDVTRALSQQLPQLLGGFGALGAAIGAGVAIFGPYIGSLIDLGERTKTVEQATKDATDAMDRMETSQAALNISVAELREKYGAFATEISSVNAALAELDKREAFKAIQVGLGAVLSNLQETVYIADEARVALDEIASTGNSIATLRVTETIAKKLGLNTEELSRGVEALKDVQRNANLATAVPAARAFVEELLAGTPAAQQLGRELSTLLSQALQLEQVSQRVSGAGFSFTPEIVAGIQFTNSEGDAAVAAQLVAIEERVAAAKRATAKAAQEAAAAQREQRAAYDQFISSIDRGVTPLQRTQDTLRKAEENFARFRTQMSPEEVAAYSAYIGDLNTKIADLTFKERWDEMSKGITAAKDAMTPLQEAVLGIGQSIQDSFVNGLADAFSAFIEGTATAEEAFKQFATSFLKEITAMIIKAVLLYTIQSALGMGGGAGINIGGMTFGGLFAKGGVFSRGRELNKFASGGIVNGPTLFPMAGGSTGLMGEAGPEAIVPLTRRNGKLGVEASPVNVTVINNSSAAVSTRRSADGGLTIEVVEEAVANAIARGGNKIDSALSRGYGLRRAGR